MKNTNRNIFTIVLLLIAITLLVYWSEKISIPYHQVFRYLYFLPILFASIVFDFAGTIYISIAVSSLYVPILLSKIEQEGFSYSNIELSITIFLFLLTGLLIGKFMGGEKKKKDLYKGLSQIGEIIASSFNLEELLPRALKKVCEITESSKCAIVFFDKEKEYYTLVDDKNQKQSIDASDNGILDRFKDLKKPLYCNNVNLEKRFVVSNNAEIESFMVSPVIVKEKNIGALIVENKKDEKRYTKEDLDLIFNIATQLGSSVTNLKLYELAVVDGLTQLYTHRFFQIRLREELKKWSVSLIIADIDHFKKVNDTFGHQEGDVVLKSVAKIVSDTVGEKGICCRYGGEEFAIILPNIKKDDAIKIAEEIREKIHDYKFVLKNKEHPVTASFGISSSQDSSVHPRELIEEADQELYRAKDTGRNKVCWKK